MIDLDRVLRKHARASSIKLAVSVGSTFTLVISVNVLKELMKLAAKGIQKIPARKDRISRRDCGRINTPQSSG